MKMGEHLASPVFSGYYYFNHGRGGSVEFSIVNQLINFTGKARFSKLSPTVV